MSIPPENTKLIVVRTGDVPFHGETVRGAVVLQDDMAEGWVRVSDVCERLGIEISGQLKTLENNPSFCTYLQKLAISKGRPGWYIAGHKVPGWIRTINASKVKPEARDALLWLQEQFDAVLNAWVTGAAIPASPQRSIDQPSEIKSVGTRFAQSIDDLVDFIADAVTTRVMQEFRPLIGDTPINARRAAEQASEANALLRAATKGGWVPNGSWYIAVNERDGIMSLGETSKDPAPNRIDDSDYNGHKSSDKPWAMVHHLRVDDRKKAQTWIQGMARQFGCARLGGDKFALDWDFINDARRITDPATVEELRQVVDRLGLFLPLMFRDVA